MATETDAARDRVLAARAALGEELDALEASARAAVDIPAKIGAARPRRLLSPAAPGSSCSVVQNGSSARAARGLRSDGRSRQRCCPRRSRRRSNGRRWRQGPRRDRTRFRRVREARQKDRSGLKTLIILSVAKPLLSGAAKAAASRLFGTDDEGFQARLEQIRERAKRQSDGEAETPSGAGNLNERDRHGSRRRCRCRQGRRQESGIELAALGLAIPRRGHRDPVRRDDQAGMTCAARLYPTAARRAH